jgi:hypothetical protein
VMMMLAMVVVVALQRSPSTLRWTLPRWVI